MNYDTYTRTFSSSTIYSNNKSFPHELEPTLTLS